MNLKDLVAGITPQNLHEEISTGHAVGNEFAGQDFDDFLKEEGIFEECEAHALQEVENWIRLSPEDQLKLAELILNPPPLSPALERAKEAYARLIRRPNTDVTKAVHKSWEANKGLYLALKD